MKDLHAIKVLDPQLTQNPQLVTRFVNEARAAARLRHRNLVRVHNIERIPGDGAWFMVLDYLQGRTLAHCMASINGPMPMHLMVHILAQVANCIQHVHDHNIIHRDLKPDNIFLIQQDEDPYFPIVLDLGVAQLGQDLSAGPATRTGTVIGTPIYMAPEQLRGERVSPAADVFALGVIAYEMITGGFFPYQYEETLSAYYELPATEIYYRQRTAPPYDPRRRCPGLGQAWVDVLHAALAHDPGRRPPSVRAFALQLAAQVAATHDQPDGLSIVRQVARELTRTPSQRFDRQASQPPVAGDSGQAPRPLPPPETAPAGARERTTWREPSSTLAGVASQSLVDRRTRSRWQLVGGTLAALVTGALVAFAAGRMLASDPPLQAERAAAADPPPPPPPPPGAAAREPALTPTTAVGPSAAPTPTPAPPTTAAPNETSAPTPGVAPNETSAPTTTVTPRAASALVPAIAPRTAPAPPVPSIAAPAPATPHPTQRPPAVTAKTGQLAIIVRPWAYIWLNGKAVGQTPFREDIAAGRYRLRISNDDAGKDETTVVVVNPDQTTTIQRTW